MTKPNPFAALDQPTSPPDKATSQRLFQFGRGALIAAIVWFIWQNRADVDSLTLTGIGVLILSSIPVLNWARRQRSWFPAFEVAVLTCIPFYAIPLLSHHADIRVYPKDIVLHSAILVLIFLGAANFGFSAVNFPKKPSRWAIASLMPQNAYRYVPLGLVLNTLYLYFVTFTTIIPTDLVGTLRALFFGIGTLSTFILARLWGMGLLSRNQILFFIANIIVQLIFLFSELYLITGISLVSLALIAYSAARHRVPWVFLALFTPLVALLHLGKTDMRRLYWEEQRPAPTLTQLPAFFSEWIQYSLQAQQNRDEGLVQQTTIFERASLIQMLCLCVDRVPETYPYLYGESYVDIPAQVIPRFLWPDKPSSLMSNVRLGIYFHLIDPNDPFKVSIAFGMIAEAFVNFGHFGVGLLGFIFGAAFKRISLLAQNVPQFSALGIFTILLTAWSFQAELVLAAWISSLFQASVVCIGIPLVYRHFTTN